MQLSIQPPHRLQSTSPEKCRRLNDEISHMQQPPGIKRFDMGTFSQKSSRRVDEIGIAVDDGNLRMGGEVFGGATHGVGGEGVIGIEPGEDLAATGVKTLHDGVGLPVVGLADPLNLFIITPQHVKGCIGRAAIDDAVKQVGIILLQNALNGGVEVLTLIERGGDDQDAGQESFHRGGREYTPAAEKLLDDGDGWRWFGGRAAVVLLSRLARGDRWSIVVEIGAFVANPIRRLGSWFKGNVMAADEMDQALDHLTQKGYAPKVVLDIGSAKGYWSLRAGSRWKSAEFYMIDPLTESEPSLKQITEKHARYHYLLTAVGESCGEVVMNLTPDCDGSSALDYPGADPARQRRIPLATIDSLIEAGRIPPPNLVKLDVQGFEMQVLRGGEKLFKTADVLIVELNLYRFMPACPLAHEVIGYLAERGYQMFDLAGSLRRPFENDLGQIDVVFVRSGSPLIESTRWA